MRITKVDVMWSLLATFFRAASTALLLPLILKLLPAEERNLLKALSRRSRDRFAIGLTSNGS
jgi:hypothetical protein